MSVQLPEHTPKVRELLLLLDDDLEALMDYYKSGHAKTSGKLYAMDMFVLGAVKRTLSANAAMILMVQTWNLVTARTLLRTHLDTALRFSAAWLVDDPEKFALTTAYDCLKMTTLDISNPAQLSHKIWKHRRRCVDDS